MRSWTIDRLLAQIARPGANPGGGSLSGMTSAMAIGLGLKAIAVARRTAGADELPALEADEAELKAASDALLALA